MIPSTIPECPLSVSVARTVGTLAAEGACAKAVEERPQARPVPASNPARALQNPRLMEKFPFHGAAGQILKIGAD